MKKELMYGIGGLVVGAVVAGLVVGAISSNNQQTAHTSMTMADMVGMLQGKSGDEFDKAFLAGMIEHHQGAVDMSVMANQYAKHDEIKKLASNIVTGQSKEIDMMKGWQVSWGYANTTMNH